MARWKVETWQFPETCNPASPTHTAENKRPSPPNKMESLDPHLRWYPHFTYTLRHPVLQYFSLNWIIPSRRMGEACETPKINQYHMSEKQKLPKRSWNLQGCLQLVQGSQRASFLSYHVLCGLSDSAVASVSLCLLYMTPHSCSCS